MQEGPAGLGKNIPIAQVISLIGLQNSNVLHKKKWQMISKQITSQHKHSKKNSLSAF